MDTSRVTEESISLGMTEEDFQDWLGSLSYRKRVLAKKDFDLLKKHYFYIGEKPEQVYAKLQAYVRMYWDAEEEPVDPRSEMYRLDVETANREVNETRSALEYREKYLLYACAQAVVHGRLDEEEVWRMTDENTILTDIEGAAEAERRRANEALE